MKEKVIILGGAGFLATNMALRLIKDDIEVTLVDRNIKYFKGIRGTKQIVSNLNLETDFDEMLKGYDIVYHFFSATNPSMTNKTIADEIQENVAVTSKILDGCVKNKIKKVVFASSGGTVYGEKTVFPIKENSETTPICAYGVQKLTIEKLLYLYNYNYGLDFRILRLGNLYGPYQRPNSGNGVIATFIYKTMRGEAIDLYGDGSNVRDFIYVDDAVEAIINCIRGEVKLLNIGTGTGTSINEIVRLIEKTLKQKCIINYLPARECDVSVNYLDVSKYEHLYGEIKRTGLEEGIQLTTQYIKNI